MKDPYSVLGISRDASADDIKKAYRKLSRMYHPDSNVNNPNKDLAEEKFKQVQEAYECIMHEREHGGNTYGSNTYGSNSSNGGGYYGGNQGSRSYDYGNDEFSGNRSYKHRTDDSPKMRVAINYIHTGQYAEALNMLDSMGIHERTARWYYVHARANQGMGNVINATEDAKMAMSMEPENQVYSDYYMELLNSGRWYSNMGTSYGRRRVPVSNCCTQLICLELVCNCLCCGNRNLLNFYCC